MGKLHWWAYPPPQDVIALAVPAPADSDQDRLPDGWEPFWGLDPGSSLDATGDADGDFFVR